jgi:PAS domain S-box-containing protein
LGTDSAHVRILHIDDEAEQCEFVKTFLEQLNPVFKVTTIQDPTFFFKELDCGDYDCVVSDFKMPEMNGIELARGVRQFSNVPFILYTGQGSEEVAEEAFAVGVNYYVRKEMGPSHYQLLERSILTAVEKYRVEERLRQSEKELSAMVENSPDSILRIENGVGVVRCNPAAEKLLEIQRGAYFKLEGMYERIHPEDRHQIQAMNASILESHTKGTITIRWLKKNGGIIWVEANIVPIIVDKKPTGVEIIARDVTTRKLAEKEIQEQREHFSQLFNLAVDPVLIIDAEGRFIEVSDRVVEVTGLAKKQFLGKRVGEMGVITKEDALMIRSNIMRRIAGERMPAFEIIMKTKSGEKVPFEVKAEMMHLNGAPTLIASLRDVSERKRNEAIIHRRLEIERTMSAVAGLFIGLQELDTSISEALRLIGELSGASRAYLFKFRSDGVAMDNTHEWCAPGVTPEIENLQGLPTSATPWWIEILSKGENIHIRDVSKLPPEASSERAILEPQGIKSLLVLPFYVNKVLEGFIGFDNVANAGDWDEDDLVLLRTSADIIGAATLRKRIAGV